MAIQLSVVIPCFNPGDFLSDAVTSVLAQDSSVGALEILVVDDQSTDPLTLRLLDEWPRKDPRVRIERNTSPRRGPAPTRNVGIQEAAGEWIAFLDQDDIWMPGGLQARWRVAVSEVDAQWIAADFKMWNLDGSVAEHGHYGSGDTSRQILERAFTSGRPMRLTRPVNELLSCAIVWTGTVLVRAALLREVGGFNESLRGPEDLHLWLRLAHRSDLFFVPEVVALYRQHPREITRESHVPGSWDVVAYRLLWDDPSFRPYRIALKRRLAATYQGIAYHHRRQGEAWPAARAAVKALRYTPASRRVWGNLAAALLLRA